MGTRLDSLKKRHKKKPPVITPKA